MKLGRSSGLLDILSISKRWVSDNCSTKSEQISVISLPGQNTFWQDGDVVCFILEMHS